MPGKYLWTVKVSQVGTGFSKTLTLTATSATKVDFAALAKKALALAEKDKDNWTAHESGSLFVESVEYAGTIDD